MDNHIIPVKEVLESIREQFPDVMLVEEADGNICLSLGVKMVSKGNKEFFEFPCSLFDKLAKQYLPNEDPTTIYMFISNIIRQSSYIIEITKAIRTQYRLEIRPAKELVEAHPDYIEKNAR